MSEENVEAFKRGVAAYNRKDLETFLEVHDRITGSSGCGTPGERAEGRARVADLSGVPS